MMTEIVQNITKKISSDIKQENEGLKRLTNRLRIIHIR